jgi:hypothetical protein
LPSAAGTVVQALGGGWWNRATAMLLAESRSALLPH